MPHKNKDEFNAYMRKYMLDRYRKRMAKAIQELGGKCVICGKTEELQFDHKDKKTKSLTLGKMWSVSELKFQEELKKCQLLCRKCHEEKTREELGRKSARETHGTLSSYRYCRCPECVKAKTDWCREYKRKRARNSTE